MSGTYVNGDKTCPEGVQQGLASRDDTMVRLNALSGFECRTQRHTWIEFGVDSGLAPNAFVLRS